MLSLVLCNNILEFYKSDLPNHETQVINICPNPGISDSTRQTLLAIENKSFITDVVTIEKIKSDIVLELLGEEAKTEVKRKADQFLYLSILWRKFFNDLPFEYFLQTYNLFTELRSFTLDFKLVEEVLVEFDEKMSQGIKLFWQIFNELNIEDEHGNYQRIAHSLRHLDHEIRENQMVFTGFTHFSGTQLDFLRALGIHNSVWVICPVEVFNFSKESDWPKWIDKIIDISEKITFEEKRKINIIKFVKGKMASKMVSKIEFVREIENVILAKKGPTFCDFMEIPIGELFFKDENQIFEQYHKKYETLLNRLFFKESGQIDIASAFEILNKIKSDILGKKHFEKYFELTVISIFYKTIEDWNELSDLYSTFGVLEFKVFCYVSKLNLPRSSIIPVHKKSKINVYGIEDLKQIDKNGKSIFCINSNYPDIRNTNTNYNDEIIEFLKAVAPVRSGELEIQFLVNSIKNLFNGGNTTVFMEESMLEESVVWNEIFENFELNYLEENVETKSKNYTWKAPRNDKTVQRLSPSSYQNYLDCPQKFKVNNLDQLSFNGILHENMTPSELGQLEHLVIETFFKEDVEIDKTVIGELSKKIYQEYKSKKMKNIGILDELKTLSEISHYAFNGITFIKNISEFLHLEFSKFEYPFEYHYKNLLYRGRVDYFAKGPDNLIILDFKRSSSSIPSKKEFLDFKKIQIWTYLKNCNEQFMNSIFGYVNLSNLEESLIFTSNKELLNNKLGIIFIENFNERLKQYIGFEQENFERIISDCHYYPSPESSKACTFCPVESLCGKGIFND